MDQLSAWLRDKCLHLILDTFEHLLVAAPRVTELVAAAPGLQRIGRNRCLRPKA